MLPRPSANRAVAMVALALTMAACARDLDTLAPASFPTEPAVFIDGFVESSFAAFGGSKVDAANTDAAGARSGTAGLKVTVPGPGDASGGYAGGAIVSNIARDLTGYNAADLLGKGEHRRRPRRGRARQRQHRHLAVPGAVVGHPGRHRPGRSTSSRFPWPPSWSRSAGCSTSPRGRRTGSGTTSGSTTSGSRRSRPSRIPVRRLRRPRSPSRWAPP